MEVESSRCWGIPFVRSKLLQEKASYLNPLIPGNNNQWEQPTSYIPQQFRSVCIHFWRWYARNSFQSTKLSISEGVRDARKIGVIIRTKGQMLHGDYSCPWQVPRVGSELYQFVLSLSHVRLFLTPWAVARQASLSITSSQSLCKLMSHRIVDAIQPSHPLVPFSSCLQSFPVLGSFQMSQFFASGGRNIGISASASVLPMNIQDWFPPGWISWISLQATGRTLKSLLQHHSSKALILRFSAFFIV